MSKETIESDILNTQNELRKYGLEEIRCDINVSDSFYKKPISTNMPLIIYELTQNCAEKGAKKIIVTLTDHCLRVEDDYIETDPQKTIIFLNKIMTTRKNGQTTKRELRKSQGQSEGYLGGFGITSIVLPTIEDVGGTFKYSLTPDNRIVAEAFWE